MLESWAKVVVEELGRNLPHRSVPHLVRFLSSHLEWIGGQPLAADFVSEVEELVAVARGIVDPAPDEQNVLLGPCLLPDCSGAVTSAPRDTDGAQGTEGAGGGTLQCSAGHSWSPREWLLQQHRADEDRKVSTA